MRIGSDPELFYHDGKKFVSAIGKIGGTKAEPLRILGGFALQEDNVSVEFNIPAVDSVEKWVWAHQLMLEEIAERGAKFGLKPKAVSSAIFDDVELATPAAQVFGCDPDFDAWELSPNPAPFSPKKNLRSAGGHIHIGTDLDNRMRIKMVRLADLLLGIPLAFLDRESERRELYGRAGACRIKPYGVEYRTPSNVWLRDEPTMAAVGEIALMLGDKGFVDKHFSTVEKYEELIKKAINTLDEEAYLKLHNLFAGYWPREVIKRIKISKKLETTDLDGAIKLIIEP